MFCRWTSGYLGVPAFFWGDKEPNNYMNHQDCVAIDPTACTSWFYNILLLWLISVQIFCSFPTCWLSFSVSNQSWFDEYCTQSLPSVCMIAKFKGAPKNVVLETKNGTCVEGFFRMGNRCLKVNRQPFVDVVGNYWLCYLSFYF